MQFLSVTYGLISACKSVLSYWDSEILYLDSFLTNSTRPSLELGIGALENSNCCRLKIFHCMYGISIIGNLMLMTVRNMGISCS